MTAVKLLYDLQLRDLEIDKGLERVAQLRRDLINDGPLEKVRRSVKDTEEQLKGLRTQQSDAEMATRSLQDKARSLEEKLYGGTVKNPRELTGMQDELAYLRKHQQEMEDTLLNTMIAMEECQGVFAKKQEWFGKVEADRGQEQEKLQAECDVLENELSRLQTQRQALLAQIDSAQVQTYEQLRKTHGGQSVAKIERGMCEVCRITLPTKELQRIRTATAPVKCNNCGRLLLSG